jgi:hypothetical protein
MNFDSIIFKGVFTWFLLTFLSFNLFSQSKKEQIELLNKRVDTDTIYKWINGKGQIGNSGKGEIIYPNGFKYIGGIINGKPDGKMCKIQTSKGSLFDGDFKLNDTKVSGNGKCYPSDGNGDFLKDQYYEGEFIENTSGTGANLKDGKFIKITNENNNKVRAESTYKNGELTEYFSIIEDSNGQLEIRIPKCNGGDIIGNYFISIISNNNKMIDIEIQVISKEEPKIKMVTDSKGIKYFARTDCSFSKSPLKFDDRWNFMDCLRKMQFTRSSDSKTFSLDENYELKEANLKIGNSSSPLDIEQFKQSAKKEENKVYSCDCCKKSINGYKNGISFDGEELNEFVIIDGLAYVKYKEKIGLASGGNSNSNRFFGLDDLSPIKAYQQMMPYCSKLCYKTCKE